MRLRMVLIAISSQSWCAHLPHSSLRAHRSTQAPGDARVLLAPGDEGELCEMPAESKTCLHCRKSSSAMSNHTLSSSRSEGGKCPRVRGGGHGAGAVDGHGSAWPNLWRAQGNAIDVALLSRCGRGRLIVWASVRCLLSVGVCGGLGRRRASAAREQAAASISNARAGLRVSAVTAACVCCDNVMGLSVERTILLLVCSEHIFRFPTAAARGAASRWADR